MIFMEPKYAIEIKSRYGHLSEEKRRIVDFLLEYCFFDDEQIYTNGTVLVPMFRVLDALTLDGNPYQVLCD